MADGAVVARRAGTSADRIVFLGHATVLIEVDGVRLLTDPLLRDRVAHLRRQSASVEMRELTDLDAVLISHMHHDHLDLASLRLLGRDTPLLVPAGAAAWMRARGFGSVTELDVGDVVNVGTLAVTAVPAHHDGRRPGGPQAATLGYLVTGGRSVYFAGDTEFFTGMSELSPLDLALLPVAGWGPKLGPGHMGPHDAARAAALMLPRLAVPVHWGTLLPIGLAASHRKRLGDPPRLFAEFLAGLAPEVEVRILHPGEGTEL